MTRNSFVLPRLSFDVSYSLLPNVIKSLSAYPHFTVYASILSHSDPVDLPGLDFHSTSDSRSPPVHTQHQTKPPQTSQHDQQQDTQNGSYHKVKQWP